MKQYPITILLIAANIVVFVLMVASGASIINPTGQQALAWGASNSDTILHGESWRLLTSMFVHFGIMHLMMNLYALFNIGIFLEPLIGKARFAAVYFATGIFAGLWSQVWHLNSFMVEAGASGAVFGIAGALIALLTTKMLQEEIRNAYLKSMLVAIGANLVYGLRPEINMAAHIGGLASGFLLGYALVPSLKDYWNVRIKAISVTGIILVTMVTGMLTLQSLKKSDVFAFERIVSEIESMQGRLVQFNTEAPENPIALYLFYQTKILPELKKGMELVKQAQEFNLSDDRAKYRDYLVKFVTLKYKLFSLYGKAVKESSTEYDAEIKKLGDELANLSL